MVPFSQEPVPTKFHLPTGIHMYQHLSLFVELKHTFDSLETVLWPDIISILHSVQLFQMKYVPYIKLNNPHFPFGVFQTTVKY